MRRVQWAIGFNRMVSIWCTKKSSGLVNSKCDANEMVPANGRSRKTEKLMEHILPDPSLREIQKLLKENYFHFLIFSIVLLTEANPSEIPPCFREEQFSSLNAVKKPLHFAPIPEVTLQNFGALQNRLVQTEIECLTVCSLEDDCEAAATVTIDSGIICYLITNVETILVKPVERAADNLKVFKIIPQCSAASCETYPEERTETFRNQTNCRIGSNLLLNIENENGKCPESNSTFVVPMDGTKPFCMRIVKAKKVSECDCGANYALTSIHSWRENQLIIELAQRFLSPERDDAYRIAVGMKMVEKYRLAEQWDDGSTVDCTQWTQTGDEPSGDGLYMEIRFKNSTSEWNDIGPDRKISGCACRKYL